MSGIYRAVLLAIGTLSVALGVVGILLPLVPTTPFLLLAAYCYARSSERFYRWLLANRFLGGYIRNFREGRGMARRDKVVTLVALWVTIGATMLLVGTSAWVRLVLLAVVLGVTTYLVKLKRAADASRQGVEEI